MGAVRFRFLELPTMMWDIYDPVPICCWRCAEQGLKFRGQFADLLWGTLFLALFVGMYNRSVRRWPWLPVYIGVYIGFTYPIASSQLPVYIPSLHRGLHTEFTGLVYTPSLHRGLQAPKKMDAFFGRARADRHWLPHN